METFLIKAAQLIVALGFLVMIHELGHYTFARIFGIRVNRFYLFFNPWFSILKYYPDKGRMEIIAWNKKTYREKIEVDPATNKPRTVKDLVSDEPRALLRFKCGKPHADLNKKGRPSWAATLYGIGWLPLGGYCDIDGMIDETTSADQLSAEPKPWEFRTKPAWERLLVMVGGVLFNFLLAIVIYAAIAFTWGEKYIPLQNATEGMDFVPSAIAAGFHNGDIMLAADGKVLDGSESDCLYQFADAKVITVLRNHTDTVDITLPKDFLMQLNNDKGFFAYRMPVVVDRVVKGEPADLAGLLAGDRIVAIDTIKTPSYTELTPALEQFSDKATTATVIRNGKEVVIPVTPNSAGKLGFQLKPITDVYEPVVVEYGIFESVPKGIEIGTTTLSNYVSSLKVIFTRQGAESLGGFGAIGQMFPDAWNWYSFWNICAFLSVALAFMNFLPIPALDGGHIMFTLWEVITRRKVPDKFLGVAQTVGFVFLLLLLVYANGMDVIRALR